LSGKGKVGQGLLSLAITPLYELDDDLKAVWRYYLGDPDTVRCATRSVADPLRKR
jgi:hypothetical protein